MVLTALAAVIAPGAGEPAVPRDDLPADTLGGDDQGYQDTLVANSKSWETPNA